MEPLQVYVRHVRACQFCLSPGARNWFNGNGLDWKDFIKNGASAEVLLATGDPLAVMVVNAARKEAENGQQG